MCILSARDSEETGDRDGCEEGCRRCVPTRDLSSLAYGKSSRTEKTGRRTSDAASARVMLLKADQRGVDARLSRLGTSTAGQTRYDIRDVRRAPPRGVIPACARTESDRGAHQLVVAYGDVVEPGTSERVDRWVSEPARSEAVVGTAVIDQCENGSPLRRARTGPSDNEQRWRAQKGGVNEHSAVDCRIVRNVGRSPGCQSQPVLIAGHTE